MNVPVTATVTQSGADVKITMAITFGGETTQGEPVTGTVDENDLQVTGNGSAIPEDSGDGVRHHAGITAARELQGCGAEPVHGRGDGQLRNHHGDLDCQKGIEINVARVRYKDSLYPLKYTERS